MTVNKKNTIFITGGHFTPAIAVMEKLLKSNWSIFYVGRKYSQNKEKTLSQEYLNLKDSKQIKFIALESGKYQRNSFISTLLSLFLIPQAFTKSAYNLIRFRPTLVLTFGGFLAVPMAFAARILGIPLITHEQTHTLGLANKLIAPIANLICVTYPLKLGPNYEKKIVLTGIPLRPAVSQVKKSLPLSLNKPLIYICGGSQGSHAINEALKPILKELLSKYSIAHQTGDNKVYKDYAYFSALRETLSEQEKYHYLPLKYVSEDNLGWLYKNTHFAVSRAGANTLAEFAYMSIPAIFIPLPFAGSNEQYHNADFFVGHHAGIIVSQANLQPKTLLDSIHKLEDKYQQYRNAAKAMRQRVVTNGAENIVAAIEKLLAYA